MCDCRNIVIFSYILQLTKIISVTGVKGSFEDIGCLSLSIIYVLLKIFLYNVVY